jgi:hypothetical protein
MSVRRVIAGLLVSGLIVAHVGWSARVPLDWPTLTLVAVAVGIVFAPELSKLLPLIKRIKVGEAEIELQESVRKLHEEVEKAEAGTGARIAFRENPAGGTRPSEQEAGSENAILDLAARDRESAIVRLTIEIEKELAVLFEKRNPGSKPPKTIRELAEQLVATRSLSQATGTAILEFRDVRNRVIHPNQAATVPPSALASAIDSGVRILRILRSAQEQSGS